MSTSHAFYTYIVIISPDLHEIKGFYHIFCFFFGDFNVDIRFRLYVIAYNI